MFLFVLLCVGCVRQPAETNATTVETPAEAPSDAPEPQQQALQSVMDAVATRRRDVKRCHNQALADDPYVAGKVEVEWSVEGGAAHSAAVYKDTTSNPQLTSCLVEAINTWPMPPEASGEVLYPFVFEAMP